jgi:hypothetical protein
LDGREYGHRKNEFNQQQKWGRKRGGIFNFFQKIIVRVKEGDLEVTVNCLGRKAK